MHVIIAATHAGLSVGEDGATHQALEDIALMRALPNMTVFCPADASATKAVLQAAVEIDGPVYIRLGRLAVDSVYDLRNPCIPGKANLLRTGSDLTVFATGLMVQQALEAAKQLATQGISCEVIDLHTIKPLDESMIVASAAKTKAVLVCEEHSIIGGLGSAVAEVLSENCPTILYRIGVEDQFGRSGKANDVLACFGLTAENIVQKAKELLERKTEIEHGSISG